MIQTVEWLALPQNLNAEAGQRNSSNPVPVGVFANLLLQLMQPTGNPGTLPGREPEMPWSILDLVPAAGEGMQPEPFHGDWEDVWSEILAEVPMEAILKWLEQQILAFVHPNHSYGSSPQIEGDLAVLEDFLSRQPQSNRPHALLELFRTFVQGLNREGVVLSQADQERLAAMMKALLKAAQSEAEIGEQSFRSTPSHTREADMNPTLQRSTAENAIKPASSSMKAEAQKLKASVQPERNLQPLSGTFKIGLQQLSGGLVLQPKPMDPPLHQRADTLIHAAQFETQMNDFLVRQLQMVRYPNGIAEAKITLVPEHLGTIDIEIRVEDGVLQIRFITETAMGKELLESHLAGLRHHLQQQGLQVDRFELFEQNAAENPSKHAFEEQQQRKEQEPARKAHEDDSPHDEPVDFEEVLSQYSN